MITHIYACQWIKSEKVDSYHYEKDLPSSIYKETYMETLREKKIEYEIKYDMILRKLDGPGHF